MIWEPGENFIKESSEYLKVRMRAQADQRQGWSGGSLQGDGRGPKINYTFSIN